MVEELEPYFDRTGGTKTQPEGYWRKRFCLSSTELDGFYQQPGDVVRLLADLEEVRARVSIAEWESAELDFPSDWDNFVHLRIVMDTPPAPPSPPPPLTA